MIKPRTGAKTSRLLRTLARNRRIRDEAARRHDEAIRDLEELHGVPSGSYQGLDYDDLAGICAMKEGGTFHQEFGDVPRHWSIVGCQIA